MLSAWLEFRRGKRGKKEVQQFEFNLEENLFLMNEQLVKNTFIFKSYEPFSISDPKPRRIHKACVRDRVFHQAVFRKLSEFWNKRFLINSYSCQPKKGTHRAINKLDLYLKKVSSNGNYPIWSLKCDIQKFFDSVDHRTLIVLVNRGIVDTRTKEILEQIIKSFEKQPGKGLPLGNVTSQLFANIYLHELDRFVKHELMVKFYVRYCDDFVLVEKSRDKLESYIPLLREFLDKKLFLTLHPKKIIFRKYTQGVDFLGYVLFPNHCVLRPQTAKRMLKNLKNPNFKALPSYLGMLKHCNGYKLEKKILELVNSWKKTNFI